MSYVHTSINENNNDRSLA